MFWIFDLKNVEHFHYDVIILAFNYEHRSNLWLAAAIYSHQQEQRHTYVASINTTSGYKSKYFFILESWMKILSNSFPFVTISAAISFLVIISSNTACRSPPRWECICCLRLCKSLSSTVFPVFAFKSIWSKRTHGFIFSTSFANSFSDSSSRRCCGKLSKIVVERSWLWSAFNSVISSTLSFSLYNWQWSTLGSYLCMKMSCALFH